MAIHTCTESGCGKTFLRPSKLQAHQLTHTSQRPYVCTSDGCDKAYFRWQHLKRHTQRSHLKEDEATAASSFFCSYDGCTATFAAKQSLRKHIIRNHETYKCLEAGCSRSFKKKHQLRKHTCEHKGLQPFQCDYEGCLRTFGQSSHLKRHKKIHQGYTCKEEGCSQHFDRWSLLRAHVATEHKKMYKCEKCPKIYPSNYFLKQHEATHSDTVEMFQCPVEGCTRRYVAVRNLNSHVKHFHQRNTLRCDEKNCSRFFSTKQKLERHKKIHNPRRIIKKKPRKKTKSAMAHLVKAICGNVISKKTSTKSKKAGDTRNTDPSGDNMRLKLTSKTNISLSDSDIVESKCAWFDPCGCANLTDTHMTEDASKQKSCAHSESTSSNTSTDTIPYVYADSEAEVTCSNMTNVSKQNTHAQSETIVSKFTNHGDSENSAQMETCSEARIVLDRSVHIKLDDACINMTDVSSQQTHSAHGEINVCVSNTGNAGDRKAQVEPKLTHKKNVKNSSGLSVNVGREIEITSVVDDDINKAQPHALSTVSKNSNSDSMSDKDYINSNQDVVVNCSSTTRTVIELEPPLDSDLRLNSDGLHIDVGSEVKVEKCTDHVKVELSNHNIDDVNSDATALNKKGLRVEKKYAIDESDEILLNTDCSLFKLTKSSRFNS